MPDEQFKREVIAQLGALNEKTARQNSFRRVFSVGIVYGLGFFIGSAIIAVIALGILGPVVGKWRWVGDSYEKGATILHQQVTAQ